MATSFPAPIAFAIRSTPRPTPRIKTCSSNAPDRAKKSTSIRFTRPPPSSPAADFARASTTSSARSIKSSPATTAFATCSASATAISASTPSSGLAPIPLTDAYVSEIHKLGGTALGSSRGPQDPKVVVDFLHRHGINILFCVGGDGTQRGAHHIYQEITRRGLKIAIVGIPKTIDNDIEYVFRTFGFATALEIAQQALCCGHVEARGAINGIGLVKLMGRDAGFISAGATLASQEVNFCLVPEIAFPIEGPNGFLPALKQRILKSKHAVIAVAEGAGQHLFASQNGNCDASGNKQFQDIGVFLRDKITEYFRAENIPISLKYIDPSYLIRSVPANTADRLLSDQMARYAAHSAMAGNTDVLIGMWNNVFVHVPICTAIRTKKRMELTGELWTNVLLSTGQPRWPSIPGLYAGTPYEVVPPAQPAPPAELNGVASPHISLASQLATH